MRSEEIRILVGEDLGRKIRRRAAQLELYPGDYARVMLAKAVDRDLRTDIIAVDILQTDRRKCSGSCNGQDNKT